MTRTYWLSFTDPDRPKGQQFLGVCVVDVTTAEADFAKAKLAVTHPRHQSGAEWIAVAMSKAWRLGCNPGGEVLTIDITERAAVAPPRNRLLSNEELEAGGWV